MTLIDLKNYLQNARAGTKVRQVVYDVSAVLNSGAKEYPLVCWDLENAKPIVKDLRTGQGTMRVNVLCADIVEPETDTDTDLKLASYDAIEATLVAYLAAVEALASVTIPNKADIEVEYYPAGLVSVDRELAVRYAVTLRLWC